MPELPSLLLSLFRYLFFCFVLNFPPIFPARFALSKKVNKNFFLDFLQGLPRFQARDSVLKYLESQSLLVQVRDHPMSVPICSRSGDIVEPLPKPQWFLR